MLNDQLSQLWAQIVRYSAVANGSALILSLNALGNAPFVEMSSSIGKFPIWCFFIGLLASGLHLVFSLFFQLSRMSDRISDEWQKLETELDSIRHVMLSSGALSSQTSDNVQHLKRRIAELKIQDPSKLDGSTAILRNLQEWSLWLSHCLFFFGLGVIIWSI